MRETEYKGFKIRLDERKEEWELVEGELKELSLNTLKSKIDLIIKKKIEGFKVIRLDYDNTKIEEYILTNAGTKSSYEKGEVFWMRNPEGKREKRSLDNFYANTQSNRTIIEEMMKCRTEIGVMRKSTKEEEKRL